MSESSNTQRSDVDTHQATPVAVPRTNIVPLIKPRYQKKQRTNHRIEVTDSSEDRLSATQALLQHTKEVLTVHNGPMSYEQEMYFHPYELYKHGKHQIHTRSIGYTSGCDLVVTREAISEPSDVDLGFVRRHAEIDKAICLDPKARRPLTERESGKKLRLNAPRYRKYPGIRAPKNRKERNRLLNDYFATEYARKIMEKYRERQNKGECDGDVSPPVRPAFGNLPPVFYDILDLDEDAQTRALERCGVNLQPTVNNVPKNPDSGEARFQSMNARLRGEMLHALSSEFLSRQIDDLERAFVNYIAEGDANKPLVYNFRDGYGRLVCHGVAAYYHLVSESQYQADGTKITVVSWPKKKRKGCQTLTLPHTSLMQLLRKKRNDMPSCSPASTPQTTPFVRPGEADAVPPPFNLDGTPLGCESLVGLTPTPKPEESPGEPSLLGIAVYEPMPVNASYGANMTATQKKKMRKAMRASERAADDLEKTCAPHLDVLVKPDNNKKIKRVAWEEVASMSVGVQREEWDVTFLLPKEQRAVYPRVPLHNIGDVAELTRDAVATSLKMRRYASSPNTDGHCLVPGFLVYHFSPRELQHLGPVLLQPDGMSWASLCQRQGGVASMLLQIVPLNDHTNAPGKGATPVNEDPVRSGGGGAGDLPLRPPAVGAVELQQSTSSIAGEPVSPLQDDDAIGAPADKNSEKVKRVATRFLPEEHERLYSSESKFRLPDPSLVLARLREQNSLQSRSRDRFPQKLPHGGVSGSTPTTSVRVFALTYVLARVQSILSKSEARERDTGRPQPAITREGILYFAAALVKYWQTKLLLSPVAMEKAWESLPPLIRNAQCDYLRNSVYSFWKQLCEAQQLDERSPKGTQTSRQKSLQDFGRAPPPQASPSFCTNSSGETEVEEVVLVKEVTYCSSTGPLPLPVGSMANGKLAVTLSAPPQVNVNEEVVIVGHLLSRNSVGLFWWGVESISTSQAAELVFQSGESSTLLSLDTLYRQGRLTTFQVTPNTFILTMKSWSLRPSRHYRFVVEVCDVRIGEVAVSEVRLWTL